jgi:hypothetical protein
MKNAYVSLVLYSDTLPNLKSLLLLDSTFPRYVKAVEFIVVTPRSSIQMDESQGKLSNPVSFILTHPRIKKDQAIVAGLSRAVGDFVFEWKGPISELNGGLLARVLEFTDHGSELVQILWPEGSVVSRSFRRLVNFLRPSHTPIVKSVGRIYSRRAIQLLLPATAFEGQLDVLVAELPVSRSFCCLSNEVIEEKTLRKRFFEGVQLLMRGTQFGSTAPLFLAVISTLFGLTTAIYAITVLIFRGRTPEGWTTLMVATGLGQAGMLMILGLLWARIDTLVKGLGSYQGTDAEVYVLSPSSVEQVFPVDDESPVND